MHKQKQLSQFLNYRSRPGMFNLLEIFIFPAGLLAAILLFQFTQETSALNRGTHLITGPAVAALLLTISFVLWRRMIQQNHLKELEAEKGQRFQLSAALNIERNKLATLLASCPNPVLVLDIHANIIDASPAMVYLMGVSKAEFLRGKSESQMQAPDLANEILEENQRILMDGEAFIQKEVQVLNRTTGQWQEFLVTKTPFHDEHGQIAGMLVIGEDLTAQKQTEDALRSANQKLNEGLADLEERTQGVELLTEMIDLLSACQNLEEAFKIMEDQLRRLSLADSGMLYITRSSRNTLQQVVSWGGYNSDVTVFPPSDCWGLRRGRIHIVERNPVTHHHDHDAHPLICPHTSSSAPADYLCLPLVAQGETLGILHLQHLIGNASIGSEGTPPAWFTPQRVQRINIIAESLALAIANLMLRTTLRQQSIRDPLTGLYNRRYLEETLERELVRASRCNKNVGLMMIDIDHFKQFNDTHGHQAADVVLSAVTEIFSSNVRSEDLVCRYGGEEFVIVLPETDLQTTCQRAEEIREKVSQLRVQYQGQILEPISLSIGVGIFPGHGDLPEALINRVDQSLYRAKHQGRNRVEVATPVAPN